MVYSRWFAQRFGLSSGGVYVLGDGLQAIALRVVQRVESPPSCLLDLYLDEHLDVAYPEGSEGTQRYSEDADPLFFVKTETGENVGPMQKRWLQQSMSLQSIACDPSRRDCVYESGPPVAFYRQLLPRLNLLTYEMTCYSLDPKYAPEAVWLLRTGHDPSALDARSSDATATYRYVVPPELLEHAAERTRGASVARSKSWPEPTHWSFSIPARRP